MHFRIVLLTTYNDLSSMPLFSPFGTTALWVSYPCVIFLVPLVGSIIVPFDGVVSVVDCIVVLAVVRLVVVLVVVLVILVGAL